MTDTTTVGGSTPPSGAPGGAAARGHGYQALYAGFGRRTLAASADLLFLLVVWGIIAGLTNGRWDGTVASLFAIAYLVGLTMDGGTVGQRMLGMRVVQPDGRNVSFGRALLRQLVGWPLSWLTLGLGAVWMLDDANRQMWHDRIAGTIVVRELPVFDGPPWRYDPPWRRSAGQPGVQSMQRSQVADRTHDRRDVR